MRKGEIKGTTIVMMTTVLAVYLATMEVYPIDFFPLLCRQTVRLDGWLFKSHTVTRQTGRTMAVITLAFALISPLPMIHLTICEKSLSSVVGWGPELNHLGSSTCASLLGGNGNIMDYLKVLSRRNKVLRQSGGGQYFSPDQKFCACEPRDSLEMRA